MMEQKDDGYIRFRCKNCHQKLKVKTDYEGGNVINCPRCFQSVNVPMANIEKIAQATDMEETGDPGQIRLDPAKLMEWAKSAGPTSATPGSEGSSPSLRDAAPGAVIRVEEVGLLAGALADIEHEAAGEVQQLYRKQDLNPSQRAERVREIAAGRHERIEQLVKTRLGALQQKAREMDARHERLTKAELIELKTTRLKAEAMQFYARFALGLEV